MACQVASHGTCAGYLSIGQVSSRSICKDGLQANSRIKRHCLVCTTGMAFRPLRDYAYRLGRIGNMQCHSLVNEGCHAPLCRSKSSLPQRRRLRWRLSRLGAGFAPARRRRRAHAPAPLRCRALPARHHSGLAGRPAAARGASSSSDKSAPVSRQHALPMPC